MREIPISQVDGAIEAYLQSLEKTIIGMRSDGVQKHDYNLVADFARAGAASLRSIEAYAQKAFCDMSVFVDGSE